MEKLEPEISPYEYAALERECFDSEPYSAAVLKSALAIVKRHFRLSDKELADQLQVTVHTLWNWREGKYVRPATAYGIIARMALIEPVHFSPALIGYRLPL